MYAIVEVGAKQYQVKKGDIIEVEKLDIPEAKEIAIDKVLLASKDKKIEIGQPYVLGAKVEAVLLAQIKAPKVVSFKYKRRKLYHRTKGHRQQLSRLQIKDIILG
jgi:large subunit ribosomal protein L21